LRIWRILYYVGTVVIYESVQITHRDTDVVRKRYVV
jgi:hypothetical protein